MEPGKHNEAPLVYKGLAWLREVWHHAEAKYAARRWAVTPAHYLGFVLAGKAPVVLVQGVGNRWGYTKRFGDALSMAGHPVFILHDLQNHLHSIPESAAILARFIEAHDVRGAVIVGHSKGGLVGKYYLAHNNANGRVRGVVAMATPWGGTPSANRFAHPAFQELREDSPAIAALEARRDVNARIISIYPRYDTHIWGTRGSYLEGARQNIKLPIVGHNAIINRRAMRAAVLAAIDELSK